MTSKLGTSVPNAVSETKHNARISTSKSDQTDAVGPLAQLNDGKLIIDVSGIDARSLRRYLGTAGTPPRQCHAAADCWSACPTDHEYACIPEYVHSVLADVAALLLLDCARGHDGHGTAMGSEVPVLNAEVRIDDLAEKWGDPGDLPPEDPAPDHLVYFVERENLIKIGTTINLTRRLGALNSGQTLAPGMTVGPVALLGSEPGGRDHERELHARFAADRIEGTEWFRPSPQLRAYIAGLPDNDAEGLS